MTDDPGGTGTSRRGQDRRTVLKGAKVVFNDGKSMLVCRVRDLSPGGARLEFPPRQALPDSFELHVVGQPVRRCERRWTRNNIVGVRFVEQET
ncbi:MAG TPA: PilZ domain-containing protein [Dongiaceae bacterium]|jgi:hypothetical protein|nr:PilZ domain-containing protein [Dongiaceae bacterium]